MFKTLNYSAAEFCVANEIVSTFGKYGMPGYAPNH